VGFAGKSMTHSYWYCALQCNFSSIVKNKKIGKYGKIMNCKKL